MPSAPVDVTEPLPVMVMMAAPGRGRIDACGRSANRAVRLQRAAGAGEMRRSIRP